MLSLALYSLASSSIATHQHVLEPLRLRSQVNVSLILYNAHLETGMAPLYWLVWSIKVGVAAKFFVHASHAYCQAPPYWIRQ